MKLREKSWDGVEKTQNVAEKQRNWGKILGWGGKTVG